MRSAQMPHAVSLESAREEARRLEADNPLWIVVFGIYTKEFVCFPRFTVPGGAIVIARHPGELPPRMRRIERAAPDMVAALEAG